VPDDCLVRVRVKWIKPGPAKERMSELLVSSTMTRGVSPFFAIVEGGKEDFAFCPKRSRQWHQCQLLLNPAGVGMLLQRRFIASGATAHQLRTLQQPQTLVNDVFPNPSTATEPAVACCFGASESLAAQSAQTPCRR